LLGLSFWFKIVFCFVAMLGIKSSINIYLQVGLSILSYWLLFYDVARENFTLFFGLYSILFGSYFLLWQWISLKQGIALAIGLRFLAFFAVPELSDDYFRFLWDGGLWHAGINPFLNTPQQLIESEQLFGKCWSNWYQAMNSPHYYSVYPPLNQYLFASSVWIGKIIPQIPEGIVIKFWILVAELATLWLLPKTLKLYGIDSKNSLLYALNPLVVIELCGNGHFEGVMLFFVLCFVYLFKTKRLVLSAVALGAAISVKLFPIWFIPLLVKRLTWSKFLVFGFIVALVNVLLFMPFATQEFLTHFSSSIGLYFQSFQFNSFIYWIAKDLAPNSIKPIVAPALLLFPIAALTWFSFSKTSMLKNLPAKMGMSQAFYYFFSAVVHPWYLSTVVLLSSFHPVKYILVWSYVVGLSYFTYRSLPYEESPTVIALEYLFVFVWLFIDWIQLKRKRYREDL
jgi:hypothetical protein